MRSSTLLAPELAETLRTSPEHAAELAEELHAVDLAELIDGLSDEQAVHAGGGAAGRAGGRGARRDGSRAPRPALRAAGALAGRAHRRRDVGRRARRPVPALPDEVRADLLARMPKDASLDVRELIRYPETSAGGLMTTDFVAHRSRC